MACRGVRDAAARGDLHLLGGVRAAFTDVVGLAGVAVLVLVLALVGRGGGTRQGRSARAASVLRQATQKR